MSTETKSADILNIETARAKRHDFAAHTGFDTAGAYLQNAREKRGLSIEEVATATNIKSRHIRALEQGDLNALPPRAFVTGFVKTYAEFLELDSSAVATRFREDVDLRSLVELDPSQFETAETRALMEKRDMSLLAVIFVLAFFLWCAWQIATPKSPLSDEQPPNGFPAAPYLPSDPAILDPLAAPLSGTDGLRTRAARVIERPDPVYPRFCEGAANDIENVEVTFNVTADGRVAGARVLSTSNSCFNRAAINAVKRWRFAPRLIEGKKRPAYDQVWTFPFKKPA